MTVFVDRASMTTLTVGTGIITLAAAVPFFQSFAAAGVVNGDVPDYLIEDGLNWEIGSGTYTSVGTTLTRNRRSSSTGALLALSGSAIVSVVPTGNTIQTLTTAAAAKLPLSGGTLTGGLVVTGTLAATGVISGPSLAVTTNVNCANFGATGTATVTGALTSGSHTVNGNILMPNQTGFQMKDAGGTYRNVLYVDTANMTNIVNAGGVRTRFYNQAQTVETGSVDNVGNAIFAGNVRGATITSTGTISGTTIAASSGVTSAGNVAATFSCTAANGGMIFGPSGTVNVVQFSPSWYLNWNTANGDFSYQTPSGQFFFMRQSDGLSYSVRGPGGGLGLYVNISDERTKANIEDAPYGLDEILKLRPVVFDRKGAAMPRQEIGFVAHEVKDIMPHAVIEVGMELEDGSGGIDSDDPTLGVTDGTITAALVNAVKTLTERIKKLEKGGV